VFGSIPAVKGYKGKFPFAAVNVTLLDGPAKGKLLGMVTPVLISWNGLAKLGFGAPDVAVVNGGAPTKLEGLLFLGTIVVNTIATPDAGLAGASRQPPAPPRAVGKSNARPKIVEGLGHARGMNAGVALEDKADRSVGENDGLLSGPESEHSVPIVGHIYNRSVNLPAYAISDRQVRS